MRSGLEELAYMNDDGTLYLLLEDTVYAIDVNMGKMEVAYKDLNSSNCTASGDGIFVMCDGGDENAGERLKIVDLNSGKERTIEGGDWRIVPLGYAGKDLIYGLIDPQMLTEDSSVSFAHRSAKCTLWMRIIMKSRRIRRAVTM